MSTKPEVNDSQSSSRNVQGVAEDEDKNKSRYHLWKQKYVGDQIRDPQPLPSSKKAKTGEASGSSSLSTALGYIITPVRYLASALTYSSSQPDKPPDKPKYKHSYTTKKQSYKQVETSPKKPAVEVDAPQTTKEGSLKIQEPILKAIKTIPLSEITAPSLAPAGKTRIGTPTAQSKDKDKKSTQKQKPGNNKKVHEIKKSQSQQIKGSPKVYKSYSPERNGDTFPAVSNTKLFSVSDMKIVQANSSTFRIVSKEDINGNSDADAHASVMETNPALVSKSNNSNIVCHMSPLTSPLKDELSFADDSPRVLVTYPAHNTVHSLSNSWNVPDTTSNKYGPHPELGPLRNRRRLSQSMDLANVPEVLENVPCDREAIETIFSGNLLIQCTPTQLMSGHKSNSMTQDSLQVDAADLRETLLANNNTQRLTSPQSKWQPLKDYEGESNLIILPTGPLSKKPSPFSPKNSPKIKPKSQKTPKTKSTATAKQKTPKQDSGRFRSPSSSMISDSRFSSTVPKPKLPRPMSELGSSFKRTTVFFHTVPKKKEEINKEEIKKEEIKKEEIKREDIKKEEIKKEIKKEDTKKVSSATHAVKKAAMAGTGALAEAVMRSAVQEVTPPTSTDAKAVNSIPATGAASERYASPHTEDTWIAHAIRSLSPKRKDPSYNVHTDSHQAPDQPHSPSLVSPPAAAMSTNSVTITSASVTETDTISTQGGVSRTAASAVREALKFTSAVREAMRMSRPVNMLGKKNLSSLSSRVDYDPEKQEEYPKYFSIAATLHGEFP